jgi:MFS family permease
LLYLGEGAPIGFIWWALPTWLRLQGMPIDQITILTGLLVLPWVFKFLWAPLIDRIRDTRRGLRACIVVAQLAMGATLLPLIWLNLAEQFEAIRILLFLHALAAATQDVAVDALALRIVPPGERGKLNGGMQAGMLLGRSVFGGGALVLSAHLGWPVVICALIGCVWLSTTAVLMLPKVDLIQAEEPPRLQRAAWMNVLQRPSLWLGLLFAVTAGAAYESAGVLCGPMLVDRGVSQANVGWLLGIPVVAATIVGGLVGGFFSDRFGRAQTVIVGIVGFSTMVLVLAALSSSPTASPWNFFVVLTVLYFCIGLFTAASYALFMGLSRPPLAATQFSAFMSATNGCEAWAGWLGGLIVSQFSYSLAFVLMSVVSLCTLPLVRKIESLAATSKDHAARSEA